MPEHWNILTVGLTLDTACLICQVGSKSILQALCDCRRLMKGNPNGIKCSYLLFGLSGKIEISLSLKGDLSVLMLLKK